MKENQTQPKSFRITEETANKLKEIASINGKNQQETLAMLIQVYELQEGKEILPGKRDDIEKFEGLLTALTRMYMSALEDGKNAMTVAKSQYEAQLNSKDNVILDLQKKNKELQESNHLFSSQKDTYEAEIQTLRREKEEYEKNKTLQKESFDHVLQGKDELLQEKNASILSLQEELKEVKARYEALLAENQASVAIQETLSMKVKSLTENNEALEMKVSALEVYNDELHTAVDKMKDFYEEERERMEAQFEEKYQLALDKAIFQTKKEVESFYEERLYRCQNDLDQYREKYYALFEKKAEQ